jgi:hypothetical protein
MEIVELTRRFGFVWIEASLSGHIFPQHRRDRSSLGGNFMPSAAVSKQIQPISYQAQS